MRKASFIATVAFGGMSLTAYASSPLTTVAVRVLDPAKETLPGATVQVLQAGSSSPVAQGFTNAEGQWTTDLAPGAYSLTVSLTGFKSHVRRFKIGASLQAHASEALVLEVKLKLAGPVEIIELDDTCAFDSLRDVGIAWRLCRRDLDRLPVH